MEFRAQESDQMRTTSTGSLNYTHLTKDQSPGAERRKSLITSTNGNSTSNCTTQTLDNIYPRSFQHQPVQLHAQQPLRDPDNKSPDPMPFSPLSAVTKTKTTSSAVKYRECLKNHAASVGGNVFDGCGEFMPNGQEGSLEALKCAACQCHRNFHRKEIDGETQLYSPGSRRSSTTTTTALMLNPLQLTPPLPSPSLHHHHPNHHPHHHHHLHKYPIVQPMNVAFGGVAAAGTESSSEDLNVYGQSTAEGVPPPPFALSKKRFRTKFTQEQKERMLEFAEKVGWRIQKQDEVEVERFCAEVGVKRQVLKVWMHNNKSAVKKQQEMMMMMGTTNNNSNTSAGNIHDNMQSLEVSEAVEDGGLDT
ncbi:hypothetical protein L484_009028 [Morus notabilis]|uniref:ZF-HD dimerization-type domain-containing protein n=1 Tax=Morus notabilis TaxID=981085 RepID=W9S6C3_9ROSA|nr:zinc-finger homeodomain protein 5 [Morus notabilis]EXB91935.1 hypothetical protein L484_009028 [Morus notabilis]